MADDHADKAPDAYRTISEVADDLDLPQHVLRFWETRFSQIKPLKRGGGRRYYRPDDVALIIGIRELLYSQGFTIKGVQKILREHGARHVQAAGRSVAPKAPAIRTDAATVPVAEGAAATLAVREQTQRTDRPVPSMPAMALDASTAHTGMADHRRDLESVLQELIACQRVLAAARNRVAA
ncbi:MAG: MerR family transcriptional regulator [Beijerinckiaceae bacterium]